MKYKVQNIVNNEYLDDGIFLLPNGEVGYFIEDGSYPHYRKFGNQEKFKVINTEDEMLKKELEKVKKQLEIAKSYLNERADKDKYADWVLLKIEGLNK